MEANAMLESARLAWAGAKDFASGLASPTLRLGVTGLSRAGKTVFITALAHALTQGTRLPLLGAQAHGRIRRAYLSPGPDPALPRFAYESHLAALTGPDRHWPESTRRLSQLRITLEIERRGLMGGRANPRLLHLDIIDYPGEWLLDLPLMAMTYRDWADGIITRHPGLPLALASAPADDATAEAASLAFRQHGKDLPGRFLMPGDLEGSGLLTFAPVQGDGPLAGLMQQRYEAYVARVVRPFWRDHLARLDRQIVLVDALGALNEGPQALAALSAHLTRILAAFRQGANDWASLLLGRRIDRILFAATKADLLHHTSHDRLEAILARLVDEAATRARFAGAEIGITAMASVRATREARVRDGQEELACITGTPQADESLGGVVFDGQREAAIFPGDLPAEPAAAFDGSLQGAVAFVRLRPPREGLPHIRLDKGLEFLFGDRLT